MKAWDITINTGIIMGGNEFRYFFENMERLGSNG
jgi:hypothetical protein